MREFSTHFAIIPEDQIHSALMMGENVALPSGAREFSCTSKIIFDQSPAESESGKSWTQTFRAVTKDPEVQKYDGTKACIGVILTDGDVKIIGGAFGVPVIKVTPYTGTYVVDATLQTPRRADL